MEKLALASRILDLGRLRWPHKPSLKAAVQRVALALLNYRARDAPLRASYRVLPGAARAKNISRAAACLRGACKGMGLMGGKAKDGAREPAAKDECAVEGCGEPAVRHFAFGKVESALENEKIKAARGSVGLCRKHYREFKKSTKEDRDLERARW